MYNRQGYQDMAFYPCHDGCTIGENCNLGQNVVVSPGVILGNQVKVQNNVSIYTGVICEDDVFLGPSMVFTNVINPRSAVARKDQYKTNPVWKRAPASAPTPPSSAEYSIGSMHLSVPELL